MTKSFQAVYQRGVLRPIEALDLQEQQVVHITISEEAPLEPWLDAECLTDCADEADDAVTLEQVRAALAVIPGSLTEDFIAEREERSMSDNFFDTSALGKYYHAEVGTAKMDQLLAGPATRHFISRLTVAEMQSVFAKKVRTGALALPDFQLLCRRFLSDIRRRTFQVVRVTSPHFLAAEQLLRRLAPSQNLRTLDAIQLAVALSLSRQGLVHQLVCADRSLCSIAAAEGLAVLNPEIP